MSVILGTGEHRYKVVDNWAKLPNTWTFLDVAAVAQEITVILVFFLSLILWNHGCAGDVYGAPRPLH